MQNAAQRARCRQGATKSATVTASAATTPRDGVRRASRHTADADALRRAASRWRRRAPCHAAHPAHAGDPPAGASGSSPSSARSSSRPTPQPATLRDAARGCAVVVVRAQLPDDIFEAAPSLIGAVRHGAGVDMIPIERRQRARRAGRQRARRERATRRRACVAQHAAAGAPQRGDGGALRTGGVAGWAAARALADERIRAAPGARSASSASATSARRSPELCRRAWRCGCSALTRSPLGRRPAASVATRVPLDELLAAQRLRRPRLPADAQTRGLIGASQLALMRPRRAARQRRARPGGATRRTARRAAQRPAGRRRARRVRHPAAAARCTRSGRCRRC